MKWFGLRERTAENDSFQIHIYKHPCCFCLARGISFSFSRLEYINKTERNCTQLCSRPLKKDQFQWFAEQWKEPHSTCADQSNLTGLVFSFHSLFNLGDLYVTHSRDLMIEVAYNSSNTTKPLKTTGDNINNTLQLKWLTCARSKP